MSAIKGTTKVKLVGRGDISIGPNDHVATGGEGSIYKKARTIVKIYTDSQKMRQDNMPEKLALLAKLQHDYIVAPTNLVLNSRDQPIGYYMPFAAGEHLSRMFTNDFRQREGFTDKDASILVDRMLETVTFAHANKAIMVDANELNWQAILGGSKGPEPRVLDVDSWAIGQWPATVIMPSIRDWNARKFGDLTDWFSWGIVTFQIYSGIHPYKGRLEGYKPSELEKRMRANASVFTQGVRLNRAVRDFGCIPGRLLDWYIATFEHGERTIPPSPFEKGVAARAARIARVVVTAGGTLTFDKLLSGGSDPAIRIFSCGVILQKSGRLYDLATKREIGMSPSHECEVVRQNGGWLKGYMDGDNELVFSFINGTNLAEERLTLNLKGQRLLRYDNRLFVVTDRGLTEVKLTMLGKPILSVGSTWGVVVNSTRWFDGIGIQDAMGATFLHAPFGEKACAQLRVRELDGLKPIAAKAGERFIVVMAVDNNGEYQKIELTLDRDHRTYAVNQERSEGPELNVTILPKKVSVSIVDDGELNIFVPTGGKLNTVKDSGISTEMLLGNWDDTVMYIQKGDVWSVKMK